MIGIERRIAAGHAELLTVRGARPRIEGYAAVFNQLSEDFGGWRERILPGAFDAVLATKPDVRALFNHDSNVILGRTTAGTLELRSDKQGLRYSIDPPESRADVVEAIERGDVTGSSFAFTIGKGGDEWRTSLGGIVREIRSVCGLFDVGPVVYPAYPDTAVAKRSFEAIAAELLPGLAIDEAWRRIRILEIGAAI